MAWEGYLWQSLGALVGAYVFGSMFRHALLGSTGTKQQQFWVFQLMGIAAVGFGAVGAGEGSLADRISNPPTVDLLVIQPLAALVVGLIALRQRDDAHDRFESRRPQGIMGRIIGVSGRALALIVVVPVMVVGLGNIVVNVYNLAFS